MKNNTRHLSLDHFTYGTSECIVSQIYRGLLNREADDGGVSGYAKIITKPDGIVTCIQAIIGSDEFAERRGTPKPTKENIEREKIVFLHLPKTGGSTLHELLTHGKLEEQICPSRHNNLYTFVAGDLLKYSLFSGHYDYPSLQLIPGRKSIITMFRKPIDRLVSLYNFQRSHRIDVISREGLYLAHLANKYSMADFFRLDEVRNHPAIDNAMTRVLTQCQQTRWEHQASSVSYIGASDLEKALKTLDEMRAFGFVEYYEQSVEWIFTSLGLAVPSTIPRAMSIDTLTRTLTDTYQSENTEPVTNEAIDVMQNLVRFDAQLYDKAISIFNTRRAKEL